MAILANYHTHTPRCHHAKGSEEEYIETALRCGYQVLGFSDHSPWQFPSDFVSGCRMLPAQLSGYVSTLRALQQKYAGRIRIPIGLEAEYYPDCLPWLREQKEKYQLDYLIFGNHFYYSEELDLYFGMAKDETRCRQYAESAAAGMESGLYCCMAHPDLFLYGYPAFDRTAETVCREICAAAAHCGVVLEYNLLGEARRLHEPYGEGLGYTRPEFWQIAAEYPIKAIVGCDAHEPAALDVVPRLRAAQDALRAKGIEVLETLPGLG